MSDVILAKIATEQDSGRVGAGEKFDAVDLTTNPCSGTLLRARINH